MIPITGVPHPKPVPSYGDVMTLQEWVECVACGALIDYDGCGEWSDGMYVSEPPFTPYERSAHLDFLVPSHLPVDQPNFDDVMPSKLAKGTLVRPAWATHVLWFNR